MIDEAITAGRARAVAAWKALKSPRLGMRGYLCVLSYLSAGPATSFDIAADFGLTTQQHARELINRMGELGMAHTVGKVRTGRSGPLTPLWLAGPGVVDRMGSPCRQRFPELMQLRRILQALEDPCQAKALARDVGSNYEQVQQLLVIMRTLRMAHVVAWDMPNNPQGGGVPVACWALGSGRDVPRPKRMGNLAVKRAWYARNAAKRRADALQGALCGVAP
jgi:hypothetical protein